MIRKVALILLLSFIAAASFGRTRLTPTEEAWNKPVAPFRIVGNVYYVGATEVASYLITGDKGHILLDSGFFETVPQILQNVQTLGFEIRDIRFLVMSHAHFDHVGGIAELARQTGATIIASEGDKAQLERGGLGDFAFGDRFSYEPVKPDRIVRDGETIVLGTTRMKAHLTPGHTRGTLTWTTEVQEEGKSHTVLFLGSLTAPDYQLWNNPRHPTLIDEYRLSFAKLKKVDADVFLANHGSFFGLMKKIGERTSGKNPFIRPGEFGRFLERSEQSIESTYARQRLAAGEQRLRR